MRPRRHRRPARTRPVSPTPYGKRWPLPWPVWSGGDARAVTDGAIPPGNATSDASSTATEGGQTVNHDRAPCLYSSRSRRPRMVFCDVHIDIGGGADL